MKHFSTNYLSLSVGSNPMEPSHTPATPDPHAAGLLSLERLEQLKKLAEAATPGPWAREYDNDTGPADEGFYEWYTVGPARVEGGGKQVEADAAYLEAVTPDVVLALLAYREQVAAELRGLLVEVQPFIDCYKSYDQGVQAARMIHNARIHEAARALGLTL